MRVKPWLRLTGLALALGAFFAIRAAEATTIEVYPVDCDHPPVCPANYHQIGPIHPVGGPGIAACPWVNTAVTCEPDGGGGGGPHDPDNRS
jgi:hypothetical protein